MEEPAKILVVDDEARNVKLLEAILEPKAYEIMTATNGHDALETVRDAMPDLVLLDVMMPGMDGFEVTRKIRSEADTRLIPIVMITALTETEDRIKGIDAGCDDFISKPFDKNEVLARVGMLLKLSYYRRQLDEKEKLEYVIDNMGDGLVVLDGDALVSNLNQKARDFLNLPSSELPFDLIPRLRESFEIHYEGNIERDILERPLMFGLERPETATMKPLYLSIRSSVIRGPDGKFSNIMMLISDVTEEKYEERLKSDFLSLISHKLRTPLTDIITRAEMMEEGLFASQEEQREKGTIAILNRSYSLAALIERLLAFVAYTNENLNAEREHTVIYDYLEKIRDTADMKLQDELNGKKLNLEFACPNKTESLNVKESHLNLLVGSLVDNAVIFNDKDPVKIEIAVRSNPETVDIAVSDNGIGFPLEEREKIFDEFYQIDKDFTGNVEGPGLGLALVRRLIKAYGGDVEVDSRVGEGSTFTMKFPRN